MVPPPRRTATTSVFRSRKARPGKGTGAAHRPPPVRDLTTPEYACKSGGRRENRLSPPRAAITNTCPRRFQVLSQRTKEAGRGASAGTRSCAAPPAPRPCRGSSPTRPGLNTGWRPWPTGPSSSARRLSSVRLLASIPSSWSTRLRASPTTVRRRALLTGVARYEVAWSAPSRTAMNGSAATITMSPRARALENLCVKGRSCMPLAGPTRWSRFRPVC
jgi:hypothetical protein